MNRQHAYAFSLFLAQVAALLLLSALAHADAGADGSSLYDRECADCHSVAKPLKNKKGPGLIGILDKPAASVPEFKYSDALRTANIVWTRDNIDAYIANPKRVVAGGGKMKYEGLDNADERAAIIEFLSQQ